MTPGCRFVARCVAFCVGAGCALSPFALAVLAFRLWSGGTVEFLRNHGELSRRTLAAITLSLVGTLALCAWALFRTTKQETSK